MNPTDRHQCFDQWLSEHGAMLHHVVKGFAEGDDRHDLMQELLLALWRAIPAYREASRPSTFIYRVAHNAALMWKRSQRNYRKRLDRYEAMMTPESAPSEGLSGSDHEQLERLYEEIRKLPGPDSSLILMSLDGLSYEEMAEIHGLTQSNVGVRIHRIKQKLTDAMKGRLS